MCILCDAFQPWVDLTTYTCRGQQRKAPTLGPVSACRKIKRRRRTPYRCRRLIPYTRSSRQQVRQNQRLCPPARNFISRIFTFRLQFYYTTSLCCSLMARTVGEFARAATALPERPNSGQHVALFLSERAPYIQIVNSAIVLLTLALDVKWAKYPFHRF